MPQILYDDAQFQDFTSIFFFKVAIFQFKICSLSVITQHSHLIQTPCWLLQPMSCKKVVINFMVLDSRVWGHALRGNLPHGNSKCPLQDTARLTSDAYQLYKK